MNRAYLYCTAHGVDAAKFATVTSDDLKNALEDEETEHQSKGKTRDPRGFSLFFFSFFETFFSSVIIPKSISS